MRTQFAIFALLLAGCTSNQGQQGPTTSQMAASTTTTAATYASAINLAGQAARLDDELNLAGLNTSSSWNGTDILVELELVPQSELDYTIAWGKIFSLAAYSTTASSVTIANTFEGNELVRVSATTDDIKALNDGNMTVDDFMSHLTYPDDTWQPLNASS